MRYVQKPHLPYVFISGLLAFSILAGCSKQLDKVEDIRPVRAIKLEAAQQQVVAEYSGSVRPRIESQLGFRVGGKIISRKVDVGALVKPGQVLMQLDPQDLQLAQTQAQANFTTAKTNLELANIELKRYQELRKTNAVGQSALDAKTTAAAGAQASFDQAQAAYKGQSNQAGYATLVSDIGGVVTAINAEVGQVISTGTPVVHIAKSGELEVVVGIPENNVDVVNRANQVQIRLWANPKESIAGKIRELSPIADAATRTFAARVSVVNPSPQQLASIKLGMTAFVQFSINTPNAFVKIPMTALFQERGVTSVWIVEQNKVKLVPVQIGGVSGNDLLLTAGVTAGQTVVTAGVHLLKPDQQVTILEEEVKPVVAAEPYLSAQTLLTQQAAANVPASNKSPPKSSVKATPEKVSLNKSSAGRGAVQ